MKLTTKIQLNIVESGIKHHQTKQTNKQTKQTNKQTNKQTKQTNETDHKDIAKYC